MSMQSGRGGMGSHRHGISGHVPTNTHFTGKKGTKHPSTKRKRNKTRKQRRMNRGTHIDKYAEEM